LTVTKSRESFDRDLQNLETSLLAMASEVSENLGAVTDALVRRDVIVAQQMMAADDRMNQQTIDIAQECFRLIARQQPMAGDMRFIGSVLAVVGELERIHDYVKGIGKIIEDASRIANANLLEWAMHNLERAADRATNICEWVVYMVEGQYVKLDLEYQAPPISADD
jgi:phosphate uptake regulator